MSVSVSGEVDRDAEGEKRVRAGETRISKVVRLKSSKLFLPLAKRIFLSDE